MGRVYDKGTMNRKPGYFDSAAPDAAKRAQTQAQRIVAKFGGAWKLAALLASIGDPLAVQTIYRWLYPDASGLIPAKSIPKIVKAAKAADITLTDSDWSPVRKGTV